KKDIKPRPTPYFSLNLSLYFARNSITPDISTSLKVVTSLYRFLPPPIAWQWFYEGWTCAHDARCGNRNDPHSPKHVRFWIGFVANRQKIGSPFGFLSEP